MTALKELMSLFLCLGRSESYSTDPDICYTAWPSNSCLEFQCVYWLFAGTLHLEQSLCHQKEVALRLIRHWPCQTQSSHVQVEQTTWVSICVDIC